MICVSCDICVYHLGLFVLFPGVFLSSGVTGACPVTTDLTMRVNVRTTTTKQRYAAVLAVTLRDFKVIIWDRVCGNQGIF